MANKEIKQIVKKLKAKGFFVKRTKGDHLCVATPKGPVFCASTPSDRRAVANILAMLKRKGVKL